MAQLQSLDGKPMTWAQLYERLEAYYHRPPAGLDLRNAPTTYYVEDDALFPPMQMKRHVYPSRGYRLVRPERS